MSADAGGWLERMTARAHWPAVLLVGLLSAVALGLFFLLLPVFRQAPETLFPLLMTVIIGSLFLLALWRRRS